MSFRLLYFLLKKVFEYYASYQVILRIEFEVLCACLSSHYPAGTQLDLPLFWRERLIKMSSGKRFIITFLPFEFYFGEMC